MGDESRLLEEGAGELLTKCKQLKMRAVQMRWMTPLPMPVRCES